MAEFSWAAAADVGLGVLGGVSKYAQQAGADRVASANARAQNIARDADNVRKSSELNLAATIRGINNRRIMEHGARQIAAATTNALRTQDSFVRGNFEQTIRDAEQYGATAAHAAAAGIGGASIQAISAQVSMQQARQREVVKSRQGDITYDQLQAMAGIIPESISRMDFSPLVAGFDRNVNTTTPKASIIGSLLDGLLDKKASLHTLLGSFGGSDVTNGTPATGAKSYAVKSSTLNGQPLADFSFGAEASPVRQSAVNGVPLAPISII